MTRLAYFDLANGVSGDMTLACLAHAGRRLAAPVEEAIVDAVASLPLEAAVSFVDEERGGIACLRAEVKTGDARHMADELRSALEAARVSDRARSLALRALGLLVEAEAVVHNVDPEDVHLHELSSIDTAADLIGAAVGLEVLGVDRVASAPVPVPGGWVSSEHGALPLPAPATLEILRGVRLKGVDEDQELVTPSGAAILVAAGARFGPLPEMTLLATGIGAGSRIGARPNICRVLIGDSAAGTPTEVCVLLEANIDDQTPEAIAHAIESLIAQGALDAWVTPIVMKKSRPAFQVCVLTAAGDEARLTDSFFRLTTTLGIRRREATRSVLEREEIVVEIEGHTVRVKIGRLRGDVVNVAPEFADCAAVSDATGLLLKDVFARATAAATHLD